MEAYLLRGLDTYQTFFELQNWIREVLKNQHIWQLPRHLSSQILLSRTVRMDFVVGLSCVSDKRGRDRSVCAQSSPAPAVGLAVSNGSPIYHNKVKDSAYQKQLHMCIELYVTHPFNPGVPLPKLVLT